MCFCDPKRKTLFCKDCLTDEKGIQALEKKGIPVFKEGVGVRSFEDLQEELFKDYGVKEGEFAKEVMKELKVNISLPTDVKIILGILQSKNHKTYVVGGAVRNSLLALPVKDWDICTSAKPEQVKALFKKTLDTGLQHGTVTVMLNNVGYEVTTFRQDGEYIDNRKPESVEFTNDLREDLSRRDFTINAMAYNEEEGLIDYFGGLKDLENKSVRCVGDAMQRFNEDALRMMRAVRFCAQLGFKKMKASTWRGIKICAENINNISKERIRDELCKILLSEKPSTYIIALWSVDLLEHILPELEECIDFDQRNPHHDKDVFDHILEVVDNTPKDLVLRLSALFHDIGKPQTFSLDEHNVGHFYKHHMKSMDMAKDIMKRLKFDNKTIERVCILVKEHMVKHDNLKSSAIKKFINRVGADNIFYLMYLQIADIRGSKPPHDFSNIMFLYEKCSRILNEKQPLTVKDLAVSGKDLIGLGYKEGKEIGVILKDLLESVIEDSTLNTREYLLERVKESLI